MTTPKPVRLTHEAALLANWVLQEHGTITPELIELETPLFGANKRTVGILTKALARVGEEGIRALSHFDEGDQ